MNGGGRQAKATSGVFANATSALMSSLEIFLRKNGLLVTWLRLSIAAILVVMGLTDPHNLGFIPELDDYLYLSYLAWTAALLILYFSSWEWTYSLVPLALAIDLLIFIAVPHSGLPRESDVLVGISVLGALIILKVGMHWPIRQTVVAAIVVNMICLLNCSVGMSMHTHSIDLYIRQIVVLAITSVFAIWAAYRLAPPRLPTLRLSEFGIRRSSLEQLLKHAMLAMGCRKGILVWRDDRLDDPVLDIALKWDGPKNWLEALSQALDCDSAAQRGFMVGPRKGLVIQSNGEGQITQASLDRPLRLAIGSDRPQTLFVCSLCSGNGQGILMLGDPILPAAEDILLFENLVSSVERRIEKLSRVDAARSAAIHDTRESIARDLHDSVAQSLAGAKFHLAAVLKGELPADVSGKLTKLKSAIDDEHAAIRDYIENLRTRDLDEPGASGSISEIADLCRRIEATWNVTVELDARAEFGTLEHEQLLEIQQIIREAVANSVRHGGATLVRIDCSGNDLGLQLTISDNGHGMSTAQMLTPPKSIKERVGALRGNLKVVSKATGVKLFMFIPVRARN